MSNYNKFIILFVDDEEKTTKYFSKAFSDEFNVMTASSADSALDIIESTENIALLITDQRMPGKNGVSLLEEVRRSHPEIVRILTTAYSDLDSAIEGVNTGEIFRYISKPWDLRILRGELITAMNFFLLQHERNILIQEKLSVWQRLIQTDRIKNFAIMSGCFHQFKHTDTAVISFIENILQPNTLSCFPEFDNSSQLNLWDLFQSETKNILDIAKKVLNYTSCTPENTNDSIDINEILSAYGSVISNNQKTHTITGNNNQISTMFELINSLASDIKLIEVSDYIDSNKNPGLMIIINSLFKSSLHAETCAKLFCVFLITSHHGGSVNIETTDNIAINFKIYLPLNSEKANISEPEPDWIKNLLEHYENYARLDFLTIYSYFSHPKYIIFIFFMGLKY